MDSFVLEFKKTRENEIKELRTMWFQQQLSIEKRKAFLETLRESK